MAAAAFTEVIIFRGVNSGKTIQWALTVSDVAAAFALTPVGGSVIQIPYDEDYALQDIIVQTGGTDTNFQDIFVNGNKTSIRIANKANLNTSNFRQFQNANVGYKAGSQLQLQQSA